MSKFFDKIKHKFKAWVLAVHLMSEAEYIARLVEAVERGDLRTLREGLDVPEASRFPEEASRLKNRKEVVISACEERANFKTARQVMTMGYEDVISKDRQMEMFVEILLRDKKAFEDPEAMSFCQKMGLPVELEKDGKHLSQRGRELLEMEPLRRERLRRMFRDLAMRRSGLRKSSDEKKDCLNYGNGIGNAIGLHTDGTYNMHRPYDPVIVVTQPLPGFCDDQQSTDRVGEGPRGLSARLSKTEPKKDSGQYPKHNPKSSGR